MADTAANEATAADSVSIESERLRRIVGDILAAVGVPTAAAAVVAEDLVDADEQGVASHGAMLVPMYVERIRHGSVSLATEGRVVSDRGATAVIDAGHALGQLTARQAVGIAAEKAAEHGVAAVAVRDAFHFGAAGRYARQLADRGCVGVAMCNTRPLLPAPGGGEAVVGNNPLAVAVPCNDGAPPVVLDMATSASAMGRIRMAAAAGRAIPDGWATDADGTSTTDPAAAIKGMLLPAAGPKGFGLAFMIDLLCGGLSSGALSPEVRPLYGDPAEPYGCAHFFLALDVGHFRDLRDFEAMTAAAAEHVRNARRAPGVSRVMAPGEPGWRVQQANPGCCTVERSVLDALESLTEQLGDGIP